MALCQPNIVGPLSELSMQVRVQGQLPGATVTVFSLLPSLHKVAQGNAISSDQRFPLISGVQLSSKDLLVAVQELGGDKSDMPSGDLGMGVQPKPLSGSDIGTVGFVTHLFACGDFIWIGGVIPGARVNIASNHRLGSGTAVEGYARFQLTEELPHGIAVHAHQVVPGLPDGPDITCTPDPIPPMPNNHLPAPVMNGPIRGCDFSINVSGVVDGALVTIKHGNGATESAGFDRNTLWFILQNPLKEGDKLTIEQKAARKCERLPTWSGTVTVSPSKPVDPPVVKGPLCAGATSVRVERLRPGALVHVSANGKVFDGQAPPDRTWFDFKVEPLTGGTVTALQECCGVSSAPSASVSVDPHQDKIPSAAIVGPLFACARCVSVNNVHPGATLQIFARHAGFARHAVIEAPISDFVNVHETHATITVAPYLRKDDDVFVAHWACSNKRVNSASEKVKPSPPINQVTVLDPIFDGDSMVEVRGVLPGALVEIFVTRKNVTLFAGSGIAEALTKGTIVPCQFALMAEDRVSAIQTLCDKRSKPKTPVLVVPSPRFGARPFYVIGHNPNTIHAVNDALDQGANAIEPDVNVYESNQNELCISHGTAGLLYDGLGEISAPPLTQFLKDLHHVAVNRPKLALVRFDCKPAVATAQHGATLLSAIRTLLTFDTNLNVIISVADLSQTAIFDSIKSDLRPREGLMIDEENQPIVVSNFFTTEGVTNQAFGNGISVLNAILGPNVRPSMEHACEFRAATNRPKYIDVWTVQDDDLLRRYIQIGVDGIITDSIGKLCQIMKEPHIAPLIRLATRADNPMRPANFAYGLEIHTGDKSMAGTDAKVTFTLNGQNGSSSVTVDTKPPYRMEQNDWNFVTLPSPNLGPLQSITVQRDNSGNAPDWFLDRIRVRSFRFGVSKEALFNRWIDTTAPFTQVLV
jgi:glycerophosphoryl diester phosphodiesterase